MSQPAPAPEARLAERIATALDEAYGRVARESWPVRELDPQLARERWPVRELAPLFARESWPVRELARDEAGRALRLAANDRKPTP